MLKVLMLRRTLEGKKAELAQLLEQDAGFATREAELEAAIAEVEPGNEEQMSAVNAEIEAFEQEKSGHDASVQQLSEDIEGIEAEIAEIERNAPTPSNTRTTENVMRGEKNMELNINIRALPEGRRAFDALSMEIRRAIVEREDVKAFLGQFRAMRGQSRSVSGADLSIPVVFLELISENLYRYSKLLNRVRVRNVSGTARQTIAGTVPEAVWTEMCGAINELNFVFNQVTVDGYKVAGFVPICNSILEDNDINLASWIVELLSESVGLSMDKAILYGKGAAARMPLGIVTRLAQESAPSDYPANAPAWTDLHTSNILSIGGADVTGAAFWAELMAATGATYTRYNRGTMFWAMNSKTYATLKSKLITFTATGEITAQLFGSLPVVTGDIDVLEFIPDGDIIGGYGDLYLLALREGLVIDSSYHVQFLQDNTVYRAKERADGQPIIPGAFVAININDTDVTTAIDFAADEANDAQLQDLALTGATISFDPEVYSYTATATSNSLKIEATPAQPTALVSIVANGKQVKNGGTATLTASAANPITVTVKQGNATRVYSLTITGASG